jgi:hypothetical protein
VSYTVLRHPPSRILATTDGKGFAELTTTDGTARPLGPFDCFLHPDPTPERDPTPAEPAPQRIRIFISYHHLDDPYREQLETRLRAIERLLPIEYWHDRKALAGTRLIDEILARLAVADVVLLLVSPEFMASDYCFSTEMAEALRKYEENAGIPVPIIIRPESTWASHRIGQHLALPNDGKSISRWPDPDDAWEDVSRGLQRLLTDLAQRRGLRLP